VGISAETNKQSSYAVSPTKPAIVQNIENAQEYAHALDSSLVGLRNTIIAPYNSESLKPFIEEKNTQRKEEASKIEKELATVNRDLWEMRKDPRLENYEAKKAEYTNTIAKIYNTYIPTKKKLVNMLFGTLIGSIICGIGAEILRGREIRKDLGLQ
jgi:hypothetical protein